MKKLRESLTALELYVFGIALSILFMLIVKGKEMVNINLLANRRRVLFLALLGALGGIVPNLLILSILTKIDSTIVAFLLAIGPLFSHILTCIVFRYKLSNFSAFIAITFGILGIGLIIFKDSSFTTLYDLSCLEYIQAKLTVLFVAFFYALFGVLMKKYFATEDKLSVFFVTSITNFIFSLIFMYLLQDTITFPDSLTVIFILLFVAIVKGVFGKLLLYYLISVWTPIKVSCLSYSVPLVAFFVGAVYGDELVSYYEILGCLLVFIAIYVINQLKYRGN